MQNSEIKLECFKDSINIQTPFAASKFLQDSSQMLCGQPMVSDNGDLYKLISKIEDNSKEFDQEELDSLPSL